MAAPNRFHICGYASLRWAMAWSIDAPGWRILLQLWLLSQLTEFR